MFLVKFEFFLLSRVFVRVLWHLACVVCVRAMHCCLLFKLNFSIEVLGERHRRNFSFCFYIFVVHIIITLAHTKFLFKMKKTFIVFYSVIKCLCVWKTQCHRNRERKKGAKKPFGGEESMM